MNTNKIERLLISITNELKTKKFSKIELEFLSKMFAKMKESIDNILKRIEENKNE